jgi:hypothetical protein
MLCYLLAFYETSPNALAFYRNSKYYLVLQQILLFSNSIATDIELSFTLHKISPAG